MVKGVTNKARILVRKFLKTREGRKKERERGREGGAMQMTNIKRLFN
jgi:hypothetical protein